MTLTLGKGAAWVYHRMNIWMVVNMYTKYEVNHSRGCRNIRYLKRLTQILSKSSKSCDLDLGQGGSMGIRQDEYLEDG